MALSKLEEDFVDVLSLGKSWGMSELEIHRCITAVIVEDMQHLSPSSSTTPTTTTTANHPGSGDDRNQLATEESPNSMSVRSVVKWVALKSYKLLKSIAFWVFMMLLFLSALYATLLVVCSLSPELENQIGKLATPMIYPAMRIARIALKPFADAWEISGFYSADCLVENPFFMDPVDDCGVCDYYTHIVDLTGESVDEVSENVEESNPFVIRGYMKEKIDLSALQKMYFQNEHLFKLGGTQMLTSSFSDVYNITDFFNKYNNEDLMSVQRGSGFVAWDTNSVPSSQAIRKVFPRPNFVLDQSEISLLKRLYIEGPIAAAHELPIGGFANSWYVQGYGKRHLRLVPHPDCSEQCQQLTTVVSAGDLVFYQDQFWRLVSEPVIEQGSAPPEISIGFAASFAL